MSDELTQAPVFDGPFVTFAGRTMLRAGGGEIDQPTEDTPAENAAPVDGTPAEQETSEVNWEKRFKDLQPELTKAQQENARLRALDEGLRDPERAAELLQQYGYTFGDEEDPDPGDEEEQAYQDPRVDAILQEREQERETAILREVSGHIDTLLSEAKLEVPQRFRNAILQEAWLRGGGAQITPETTQEVVKEWIDEYKALEQSAGDRYIASKRAPHVSKGGTGATDEVLPLDATPAQRQAWQAERVRLAIDS